METQQNNQILTTPPIPLPKKWYQHKGIIAIIILAVLTILVSWLALRQKPINNLTNFFPTHSTSTTGDKIYSVKEAASVLKSNPDFFNGKEIKLQAAYADAVAGLGCDDYMILMDKDDADKYHQLMDAYTSTNTSQEQRNKIPQQMQSIVSIKTGEPLGMNQNIFPTSYAIYQGHFNDSSLAKQCKDGSKRFVIDSKVKEILLDTKATYKTETINSGLVISNGKYIPKPYVVTLQNYTVTINGVLYEPPTQAQVGQITENTDSQRQQQWANLVSTLQRNTLVIYGGNKYETSIPNYPPTIISDIDTLMKSDKSKQEKRTELASLLNTFTEDTTINDILTNWNK